MIDKEKMEGYFNFGVFVIVMIFMFVSVISSYLSITSLISIWFDYKYRPIFDITFSLSILIICVYLIRERLIKR